MLYLLCEVTQLGRLSSITCHLCIWKTSVFTFILTFNHQPHLQPYLIFNLTFNLTFFHFS